MDCEDCKSVFNRLSKADRIKLQGAAVTNTITGLIRDDTEKRPWRYPFYALYMVTIATPLPFLGAATILIAATVAWAKWEWTPMAKELNARLKDSFNEASLACTYKDSIEPDPEKKDGFRIKNRTLAWETTKNPPCTHGNQPNLPGKPL